MGPSQCMVKGAPDKYGGDRVSWVSCFGCWRLLNQF
jgi:hypothetical protein